VVEKLRYDAGVLEIGFGKTFAQAQQQALVAALAMRGVAAQPSTTAGDNALTLRRGAS
jgi:hypothetical protein